MLNNGRATLFCEQALTVLRTLPSASVDSIVTDPPAGIGFMGKEWDDFARVGKRNRNGEADRDVYRAAHPNRPGYAFQGGAKLSLEARGRFTAFLTEILAECLRIAKPGAYALVWAIPRTSHWTGTAIEDAGWVIQDRVSHLFGQGFPKHRSKLKPACEDWWLAWKPAARATPLPGLDACRIPGHNPSIERRATARRTGNAPGRPGRYGPTISNRITPEKYCEDHPGEHIGRWPANVVLEHHPACVCVGTKIIRSNSHHPATRGHGGNGTAGHRGQQNLTERRSRTETADAWQCHEDCPVRILDEQAQRTGAGAGSVSRFFYAAKASRRERNLGCDDLQKKPISWSSGTQSVGTFQAEGTDKAARNHHPTVKSIALMRYLCRLITPPAGCILDCFMGSGTTGIAAAQEGFTFLGIERERPYFAIARRRIRFAARG